MERQSILVVSAHPDDEVLGCGGTLARHIQRGDEVHVLILGEGMVARYNTRQAGLEHGNLDRLRSAAARAIKTLGVQNVTFESFPDNSFDRVPLLDIVKVVERIKASLQPQVVYTHHGGDLNVDHRLTLQAVVTACRPQPGDSVRELYAFEVVSSTEWAGPLASAFTPTVFVDISGTLNQKLSAMACYETELRNWPHPRSLKAIEYLARWRGASVGCDAAESFQLIRAVRR